MEQLLNHIQNYYPLSTEAQHALQDCFEKIILPKNEYLLNEGQVCRHLYFLEKGALRGFYNLDGKEITHWFGFEKDFVTSFHSFITKEPAVENIQLLESCSPWLVAHELFAKIYAPPRYVSSRTVLHNCRFHKSLIKICRTSEVIYFFLLKRNNNKTSSQRCSAMINARNIILAFVSTDFSLQSK